MGQPAAQSDRRGVPGRKRTVSIRLSLETHQRLRRAKHRFEVETFDEAVRALLDEHETGRSGRGTAEGEAC